MGLYWLLDLSCIDITLCRLTSTVYSLQLQWWWTVTAPVMTETYDTTTTHSQYSQFNQLISFLTHWTLLKISTAHARTHTHTHTNLQDAFRLLNVVYIRGKYLDITGLKYTGSYTAGSFMTCTGRPRAVKAVNSKNVRECVGNKMIWGSSQTVLMWTLWGETNRLMTVLMLFDFYG